MPFNPDLEPEQVYENYFDEDFNYKSANSKKLKAVVIKGNPK
jgi:hypothetical protein